MVNLSGEELSGPGFEEVLDEGIRRLRSHGTWKLWSWMSEGEEFYDAEAFRNFLTEKHIRAEWKKVCILCEYSCARGNLAGFLQSFRCHA